MSSIKKTSGLLQRDTGAGQKKVALPSPKKKRCLPSSIKYAFVPVWVAVKITVYFSLLRVSITYRYYIMYQ